MTFDVTTILPTKYKAWVGTAIAVLAVLVPVVLQVSTSLPEPWPTIIGLVVAALTWLGVYRAPYLPKGTEIAPAPPTPPSPGEYVNPYRNP